MGSLDLTSARAAGVQAPPEEAPPVGCEVQVAVVYQGQRAVVTMRAMDAEEKTRAHRSSAAMAGCAWATLPPVAQARFLSLGIFLHCFEGAPSWLEEAVARDDDLLYALVGKVEAHTDAYFRWGTPAGEDGAGAPRFTLEDVG